MAVRCGCQAFERFVHGLSAWGWPPLAGAQALKLAAVCSRLAAAVPLQAEVPACGVIHASSPDLALAPCPISSLGTAFSSPG